MKRLFVCVILMLICISCSKPKEIVQVKDLNDLLEKHFKAIGLANLLNSKSVILNTESNMEVASMGEMDVRGFMIFKQPASYSIFALVKEDTLMYTTSNGIYQWDYQKQRGFIRSEHEAEIREYKNFFEYTLYGLVPLYSAKLRNDSLEFIGKLNVDGKEVYRVKTSLRNTNSQSSDFYDIDPYELTILRNISENMSKIYIRDEKNPDINPFYRYYDDYKETNGFKYASYIHEPGFSKPGKYDELYYKVKGLKLNTDIPVSKFEPAKK